MDSKVCGVCGVEYPATKEFFYGNVNMTYGVGSQCKKCVKKKQDAYRESHRAEISGRMKAYYKNNTEELIQKVRLFRVANKDEINRRDRERWKCRCEQGKRTMRVYRQANRERFLKYSREYYLNNQQAISAYRKQYNVANKDALRASKHERYIANREVVCAKAKKYRESNPGKISAYIKANADAYKIRCQKRRAHLAKADNDLTREQWARICADFNGRCAYCGEEAKLTIDHFIPVSKGGATTKANTIPACIRCNVSKHNRPFLEWYSIQPYYSDERQAKILANVAG